jgi:hypothetical protein
MKKATRARVKICCKKLQLGFGTFIDGLCSGGEDRKRRRIQTPRGQITIQVSRKQITQKQRTLEIQYCPFCGKRVEFLKSVTAKRP